MAGAALAKEADGGVPGAVAAVEHPLPGGGGRQEEPDGLGHCCGEMRHAGIDRDNQVEVFNYRGGIGEIMQVVCEVGYGNSAGELFQLCGGRALLEAVEL